MLRELHISNLAVIADARVELSPGLNCFTGQTGAGKSLVLGALELLLALRSPQNMLRSGSREARVTGVFYLASEKLRKTLADLTDLPLAEEPELILSRRIHDSGRTGASANGHPLNGAMLKSVGETLADIHGQHDAQYLLKPANQLALLDDFSGAADLGEQFRRIHAERRDLITRLDELAAGESLRKQQLELYEFQAAEIDEAAFSAGDQEQLESRHHTLSNMEKIKRQAGAAYDALYDEEGAAVGRLKAISSLLLELANLAPDFSAIAEQVREAAVSLDDAAFALRRGMDKLELDPDELAHVTERLNLLNRLMSKYSGAGGNIGDLLQYRAAIGEDIARLRTADQDSSQSRRHVAELEDQLAVVGSRLSAARQSGAVKLTSLVQKHLAELGMKDARLQVQFQPAARDAAPSHGSDGVVDVYPLPSGLETVDLLIAPNPGQEPRPLRKIASGGELSRVMLAIKSIMAQPDRVSVLVFDEIDANVGGRMGTVLGEKLRGLARHHQVLCITHLPQIAAFADRHIRIQKIVDKGESFTSVEPLEGEPRLRELAEMISGKQITDTSLAQARELLATAQNSGDSGPASSPAGAKAGRGAPAIKPGEPHRKTARTSGGRGSK